MVGWHHWSDDGAENTGENKKFYDGWVYPKKSLKKQKEMNMYLESPKLLFKDAIINMTPPEEVQPDLPPVTWCVMRVQKYLRPLGELSLQSVVHTYSATDTGVKGHGTLDRCVNGNWCWCIMLMQKVITHWERKTLIAPMNISGWMFAPPRLHIPNSLIRTSNTD